MAYPSVHYNSEVGPARDAIPVTASDANNVFGNAYSHTNRTGDNRSCRGLLVGTAGAADLVMATGEKRSAVPLQQGYNPIQVIKVYSTNLGASNIWALI